MKSDYTSQNNNHHQSVITHQPSARNSPIITTSAGASRRLGNIAASVQQHELTTKLTNGSQLSSQLAMTANNGNSQGLATDSAQSLRNQPCPIEVVLTQAPNDECNLSHSASTKGDQSYVVVNDNYNNNNNNNNNDDDNDDDGTIIASKHASTIRDGTRVQLNRRYPHGKNGLIFSSAGSSGSGSNSSTGTCIGFGDTRDSREQKPFLKHEVSANQSSVASEGPSVASVRPNKDPDADLEVCYEF